MKKYKQCQAQIDDTPLDVIPTLSNEVFLVSSGIFTAYLKYIIFHTR